MKTSSCEYQRCATLHWLLFCEDYIYLHILVYITAVLQSALVRVT